MTIADIKSSYFLQLLKQSLGCLCQHFLF